MAFDLSRLSPEAAAILALDGNGERRIPLICRACSSPEAASRLRGTSAAALFPRSGAPEAAMAGMWVYFSCFEQAHTAAQDLHSAEGSYWHAILHRQEPDAWNAGYWFRQVGAHPVFIALHSRARVILEASPSANFALASRWDPFAFIDFCESARTKPGSAAEALAVEIQLAEWQLLFDFCAGPAVRG